MWQVLGTSALQKRKCTIVAVFCGSGIHKKTYDTEGEDSVYRFPDLASAGNLEVHALNNPSIDEFGHTLKSLEPDFVYLQGARSDEEEEIGSLIWEDVDLSNADAITELFSSTLPTTVYLEFPNGEKLAEALQSKGIPYVIYWRNGLSCYAASHFFHAMVSVLQSSTCHIWDVFQLAIASFRLYCVQNSRGSTNTQKFRAKLGPRLLGEPPKIAVRDLNEGEGSPGEFPAIKIYEDEVTVRFLFCGVPRALDASFLGSLEDGLRALLNIEIRGCKLQNRVSAPPPPLAAGTLSRGVITMRCDMSTCGSAHISLLVSGSAQTCFDDQLLESHIKSEIVEKGQLVHAVPHGDGAKSLLCDPRRSTSVACGANVFEVCVKLSSWAAQVLKQLAPEASYRSLVALGIASVQGLAVASFGKDDADRFLFFCNDKPKDTVAHDCHVEMPNWLRPPAPCRKRPSLLRVLRPPMNGSSIDNEASRATGTDLDQDVRVDIEAADSRCIALMPSKQRLKVPAMRPVPRTKKNKLLPFSGASEVEPQGNSTSNFPTVAPLKLNNVPSAPVHRKSSNALQAQQVISLNPLPLKKHGCSRAPIHECSEEEFLRDVMQFLILRGHTRLVPAGGLAEFPEVILNAKRLDLYNLYREVVSRGGFNIGNGINWKGQVFSKMRNHTTTNRMTGVGNTLKRHYETYLLEYELAHDDVDGECCLLCGSSAAGDWVNCGTCGEWAHFGCDRRQGLGAFKDYAKTDGLEYICPRCSLTNFRSQSGRKIQKSADAFS
ncbi:unnamed protein product [Victoria cruziana]